MSLLSYDAVDREACFCLNQKVVYAQPNLNQIQKLVSSSYPLVKMRIRSDQSIDWKHPFNGFRFKDPHLQLYELQKMSALLKEHTKKSRVKR